MQHDRKKKRESKSDNVCHLGNQNKMEKSIERQNMVITAFIGYAVISMLA